MATTNNKNTWTYDEFKESQATLDADKNRKNLETQKPGDFTYDSYEKSDAVKQAEANYQQYLSQKPGAYQSAWQTQLDDTLNKILNREKFSYDLNGDALYQQYKDQYTLQGQQAMMDTMGQAAAMTGGYGNSYAQTVGQQTYQGYLQQLNDKVPELYQLALDKYNQEGQDLYNQYGLYADRDAQDYGRHRDSVSDYYTELSRLTDEARYQGEQDYSKYMDAYNMAYGQHRDRVSDWQTALNRADSEYWNQYNTDYGQYSDNRGLSYNQYRDSVADDQWNQSFTYQQDRDKVADEQWQKNFDEAVRQFNKQYELSGSGSGGSGGNGGNGGNGYKAPSGWTTQDVKDFQKENGLTVDGIWGPKSQAKYDEVYGDGGDPDPIPDPTAADYADWDAGEWEGYFASIRQSEGKAAAENELRDFTSKGLIPTNMVTYAAIGARGGQMGH